LAGLTASRRNMPQEKHRRHGAPSGHQWINELSRTCCSLPQELVHILKSNGYTLKQSSWYSSKVP
jgi:hypothetical protein